VIRMPVPVPVALSGSTPENEGAARRSCSPWKGFDNGPRVRGGEFEPEGELEAVAFIEVERDSDGPSTDRLAPELPDVVSGCVPCPLPLPLPLPDPLSFHSLARRSKASFSEPRSERSVTPIEEVASVPS
jgi:hypothetical protein